jgi:hypothetical protein
MRNWLVKCLCGGTTLCESPKSDSYVARVRCNLCNRSLDASVGKYVRLPAARSRGKPNLLEVR